jgi:putative nucleotidyltransferase with HDIG domain
MLSPEGDKPMSDDTAAQLIQRQLKLYSLPENIIELHRVVQNPAHNTSELVAVINRDPGLCARLLKMVNSAYYNPPAPVTTVLAAVNMLGTKQLYHLALSATIMTRFASYHTHRNVENFWTHSLCTAHAAQKLSRRLSIGDADEMYTAGLLHDIGKLVLFSSYRDRTEQFFQLARKSKRLLLELEKEVFGYDHVEVGMALLQAWRLPETIVMPAIYHEEPRAAGNFKAAASIVYVANNISNNIIPVVPGEHARQQDATAWELPGLTRDLIQEVTEELCDEQDNLQQVAQLAMTA